VRLGVCLSLSGRYARFGAMAAAGLRTWAWMRPDTELRLEDDRSEPQLVRAALRRLAASCDLLLGPYSTVLTREACALAAEERLLLWNHGGAGDDVQEMSPGHVVSVLTPASRYAEPFVDWLSRQPEHAPMAVLPGRGRFGRQVAAGARSAAERLGLTAILLGREPPTAPIDHPAAWDLLCAGSFEEDVEAVRWARNLPWPPRRICAVAAGVREFGRVIGDPAGIHGLAQWIPGGALTPDVGPSEAEFLRAYRGVAGGGPEYPAVQAAAGAELALHCVATAGVTEADSLWRVASRLKATTFFGAFTVDPLRGLQTGHRTVMVHWGQGRPAGPRRGALGAA
jgi:ABC-type branched-subunit amino acid transport system substrate-binding protein